MDIVANLEQYFHRSPLAFMKTVPIEAVQLDARAKYKCKFGCKNYNRKYSCPPESLKVLGWLAARYKWAVLFATTCRTQEEFSRYRLKALNAQKEFEIQRISSQIGEVLDSNGIDHFSLSGGSCRRCKECSILQGQACKKPQSRQTSMEAIGIDCQKTMHQAGFDFQMPGDGSINRCGCILTNDEHLSRIYFNGRTSHQRFVEPTYEEALKMCCRLSSEYSHLFDSVQLISLSSICKQDSICDICNNLGRNFACPPYADKIDVSLWRHAVLWKWKANERKKTKYNVALKTIHGAFFSLGYYFALSLRDCYCDECNPCSYLAAEKPVCNLRKLLSPSMQSQGINPNQFGEGRLGVELL